MGQVLTKNEGFSDFCEGWVPFLLEIKQKAGWLVGMGFHRQGHSYRISFSPKIIIASSQVGKN